MNGRKPSDKQIEFAKAIAEKLKINEPDYTSYSEVCGFITDNKNSFNTIEYMEEQNKFPYNKELSFSKQFMDMIIDKRNINIIYFLYNNNNLAYVGKSLNTQRVLSSLKERSQETEITHASIYHCNTEADMHILELVCISFLKPPLNKDAKSKDYPTLFTMPISLDDIDKVKIFEKTDNYVKYKAEALEEINMSEEFFEKIVLATGRKEQNILKSLVSKDFVSDHLLIKTLKAIKEGKV